MANEEQEMMESSDEEAGPGYATLARDGPKESMGSVGHPDGCTPCTFYCFTRRGCNRGADCKFCHMTHQSKLQQRREAWKKQQREKRKLMRGFAHKEDAPEAPQRPQVVRGKKPLTEEAVPNNGTSSVKSVVFTYTPSRVTLTTGQQTEIRPALFGPSSTTRRFSVLSRLPEGLTLDHQTGTISGVPVMGSPWEVFNVQVEMMDGQTEGGNGGNRAVWCCGMLWQFGQFAKLPTLAIRSLLVFKLKREIRFLLDSDHSQSDIAPQASGLE
ncbi:unnamed protein product [Cladocopium goreaui]|uniref:C3H1-type domain-containing protein n=1 Tax=Cladocopium goreaui TaxID=2562237 RepID=A0A9P1CMG4_9DINO|nr:unnamed protein product [Cladocopium goreaui]